MIPLKEILDNIENKYEITTAAIKTYKLMENDPRIIRKKEQHNKMAVTALKKVFHGHVLVHTEPEEERGMD